MGLKQSLCSSVARVGRFQHMGSAAQSRPSTLMSPPTQHTRSTADAPSWPSLIIAGTVLAFFVPQPAQATCTLNDSTYSCSGDLVHVEVEAFDTALEFSTLSVEDLTSDITPTADGESDTIEATAIYIEQEPSSSSISMTDVTVSFDGSSTYGIDADNNDSQIAMNLTAYGADGSEGSSAEGRAGSGGDAQEAAAYSVTLTDVADITASGSGFIIITEGGAGGEGGAASNSGLEGGYGGSGGDGGDGGDVSITSTDGNLSSLTTGTSLLYVQSEGGDGGNGGEADTGAYDAFGGDGGNGGDGGKVTVVIDTTASASFAGTDILPGVYVESFGGAGADGGEADGNTLFEAEGGDGGDGGGGGDVQATLTGFSVTTTADEAQAIVARSYGGDGGDGGSASGGASNTSGGGGAGGAGGGVVFTYTGDASTAGTDANAILVQSVGGFAGDAGSSSGWLSYGASDQSAGDAGIVEVIIDDGSTIATTGDEGAAAIFAQSVGGGGGKGTNSSGISAIGGSGSAGGDGGQVNVSIGTVTVTTSGENSPGIFAQSFGGGGGSGGSADGVSSIGGSGGTGGDGGEVIFYSNGASVTTSGYASDAISVSSSGGGGGSAQSTVGMSTIGGSGGSGGDGALVDLFLSGNTIATSGDDSDGIFAQSVGGGGGSGATAVAVGVEYSSAIGGAGGDGGKGGTIFVSVDDDDETSGTIHTYGERARGLFLQSVGGGGGDSGSATSVSAGVGLTYTVGTTEDGGSGNSGGNVWVEDFYHSIVTTGDHSTGIFAQSVGGGGGSSGNTVTVSASSGVDLTNTVGASAGDGGSAGYVDLTINGSIKTSGDNAYGIQAQSIGGSGGSSGYTISADAISMDSISSTTGGSGGGAGSASYVSVIMNDGITTLGNSSDAIFAQSVGGDGGSSGMTFDVTGISDATMSVTTGGSGGDGGAGGDVTVTTATGTTIKTEGDASNAIFAQSVGGSGGDSDLTFSGDFESGNDVSFTTGGDGGPSGDAGDVTVTNYATLQTTGGESDTSDGDNSSGIIAQSVASSGGSASYTVSAGVFEAGEISTTVSGNGGSGGTGGDVYVYNYGDISTEGTFATGITAQSVGGGGGSATGVISVSGLSIASGSVSVGGNGAGGGTGGDVTVENDADITTNAIFSHGILAQSLGGSGGNGGMVVSGGINAGEVTGNVNVSLGGDSGDGGNAGGVSVTNNDTIMTTGYGADGILAQSIGGSGGTGGSVFSANLSLSSSASVSASIDIGGDGGDGGEGGVVDVYNYGDITTDDFYADAIFAQSVGGDGGSGGSSYAYSISGTQDGSMTVDVTVGGSGGDGATGGEVTVTNEGDLTVQEAASNAIYAQSIGGNGGQGGSAGSSQFDLTTSSSGSTTLSSSVSVGGEGGSGSDAGVVNVYNDGGTIEASGSTSRGIYAQSVGGGGGDGGSASAYVSTKITSASSDSDSDNFSLSLSFSLGGSGGAGGDGDVVDVQNEGPITTSGSAGYAIFAQSVGGGGGNGGDGDLSYTNIIDAAEDVIDGSDTDGSGESTFEEYLYTEAETADAIYSDLKSVKSLATSYKSALSSFSVDVGGSGGASGDGGDVYVSNTDAIITSGSSGTGIFAQSVGGGGGSGGDGSGGVTTDASVSGSGSGGGDGGLIHVTNTGSITTSGEGAMGMYLQSLGGGGGTAGDVELGFSNLDTDTIGIGVVDDGSGGDGGSGGDVTVVESGAITTTGDYAHGIWAQSVGGAGGAEASGTAVSPDVTIGSAGDKGASGDVTITVSDEINVSGADTAGIFAQSVSGSDDSAGAVTITVDADITSSGDGGFAILAQSIGDTGGDGVSITIAEDVTVSSGSDDVEGYATVLVLDSNSYTITNYGTIDASSSSATAVGSLATSGDFYNHGTVTGGVTLDGGDLWNETGGVLNAGNIQLASDANFNNIGTWSPGGSDNITSTEFYGKYNGSVYDDGEILIDLEMGDSTSDGSSDVITFGTEGTDQVMWANLTPNLTGTNLLSSGDSSNVTIFTGVGFDVYFNIDDLIVSDTSTVDYSVATNTDGDEVILSYTVDFTPDDAVLSSNQQSVGDYVDSLVDAATGDSVETSDVLGVSETVEGYLSSTSDTTDSDYSFLNTLTTYLLNVESESELKSIYDQLGPGEIFTPAHTTVMSTIRFLDQLNSCPLVGSDNVTVFGREGSCVWASMTGIHHERAASTSFGGFDETIFSLSAGAQVEVRDSWFLGGAFNYEQTHLSATDFSGDGQRFQGGLVLKKELGATALAASASAGYGAYNLDRTVFTPTGPDSVEGSPTTGWAAANARVSHTFDVLDGARLKPIVDLGVQHFWQAEYKEKGQATYGLMVDAFDTTQVTVNPKLEVGSQFSVAGMNLDASLTGGVLAFVTNQELGTDVRFRAVGVGGPSFTLTEGNDRVFGEIGAALKGQLTEHASIEARVDAMFSEHHTEYAAGARININF